MVIEFERCIASLDREISEMEHAGNQDSQACWAARGAKEQAEKLFSFYKIQMVDKGRINPEPGGQSG